MMTLKLPEPLPYDYVDELIDSQIEFTDPYETVINGEQVTIYSAKPKNGSKGNIPRLMFDTFDDLGISERLDEDSEGYVNWPGGFAYSWTAREWSDRQVEAYLRGVI